MPVPPYRTLVLLNAFKRLILGQGDMGEPRSSLELHSKLSLYCSLYLHSLPNCRIGTKPLSVLEHVAKYRLVTPR